MRPWDMTCLAAMGAATRGAALSVYAAHHGGRRRNALTSPVDLDQPCRPNEGLWKEKKSKQYAKVFLMSCGNKLRRLTVSLYMCVEVCLLPIQWMHMHTKAV